MKPLTLYGCPGSGSAAVEMALQQAGLAFESVRAASWEPGPGLDALRAINPLGQIPTLVLEDGSVLSESAAILMHLGLQHPASGLLPAAANERAQALRGLVYIAANCYAAISVSDYPERWTRATSQSARQAVRQAARAQLHRAWELFADQFPARPCLSGAQPGALDFLAVVVSKWSGSRAHLRQARPDFFALLLRLEQHPAVAPVCQAHWP
mgnify:CR=1 FL=1